MNTKRPRTVWLSDSEYGRLKAKAQQFFEVRKGFLESFLRKVANAKGILFIEGKGLIEIKQVDK